MFTLLILILAGSKIIKKIYIYMYRVYIYLIYFELRLMKKISLKVENMNTVCFFQGFIKKGVIPSDCNQTFTREVNTSGFAPELEIRHI